MLMYSKPHARERASVWYWIHTSPGIPEPGKPGHVECIWAPSCQAQAARSRRDW